MREGGDQEKETGNCGGGKESRNSAQDISREGYFKRQNLSVESLNKKKSWEVSEEAYTVMLPDKINECGQSETFINFSSPSDKDVDSP